MVYCLSVGTYPEDEPEYGVFDAELSLGDALQLALLPRLLLALRALCTHTHVTTPHYTTPTPYTSTTPPQHHTTKSPQH